MKMLFCEACGDLVIPAVAAYEAKWCRCNASCCWWLDPKKGDFACWSQLGKESVSIVSINNLLLFEPIESKLGCVTKDAIDRMLFNTDDSHLSKKLNSLVTRFRPGFVPDTVFAPSPLPSTEML